MGNGEKETVSRPLDLKNIRIKDDFWHRELELVRTEVIPYQWEALNDHIPEAAPSYCMRNFKVAGRLMKEKREQGSKYVAPTYTFRGFEALPEDPANPDPDKFYGFVFQDSDFAKWIEAVAYTLTSHPDPMLEKVADEAIDVVCAAQAENGYLDTYYIINGMDGIFTNLRDHHELYCFGHLAEGAAAYYEATGKDKLLKAVERYADFICTRFGPEEGKCKGYPGHEIAEMALARLYELTGKEKYLQLAGFFLDMRGQKPYYFDLEEAERAKREGRSVKQSEEAFRYQYHQAHLPVREQSEAVGHAVRAVYLYSGMADVARLTGDEKLSEACERLWNSIVREKLYITGGIGGTHVGEAFSFPYDLPNDTAYSETCAAIGLAFFARRMLQLRADSRYGDIMEQALYNTVLAGMALDGKRFFYVNPLEVTPEACKKDERKRHVKSVRQKWFGCACCPPNIARTISSLGAYVYTQNENTLFVHLYVGSDICVNIGGRKADIVLESNFPWEGEVKMRFCHVENSDGTAEKKEAETGQHMECGERSNDATLAFRMPGWCKRAEIEVRRQWGGACDNLKGQGQRRMEGDEFKEYQQSETKEGQTASEICTRASWCVEREENDHIGVHSRAEMSGQEETLRFWVEKGYLYLNGRWQEGDEIHLNFPMEIRCISASTKVREDVGKAAIARGPMVYCLEEADNGPELGLLRLNMEKLLQKNKRAGGDTESGFVETCTGLGHEMRILKIPGFRQNELLFENSLYGDFAPPVEKEVTLIFIPYYGWNNRGEGEMSVWVRV